jgi:hypothetical protein
MKSQDANADRLLRPEFPVAFSTNHIYTQAILMFQFLYFSGAKEAT